MRVPERAVGFGIVAGLVVSQANLALFDDLIHRQASFEAVGWANWFLYLLVPILAGGVLLYYGRMGPERPERKPERALAASLVAVAVATVVLRIVTPAILHAGDVIPARLPRTLADGFSFVAQYARLGPVAGQGHRYDVFAATVSSALMTAAVAFGALAFERRLAPVVASGASGAVAALAGWYVPGGAGARIIGALWPMLVLGTVGLVVGVLDARQSAHR